ncbi:MAG: hypothetical protein Q4A63_02375 [Butyricicoccus pullicaecorum]|nr:hypothetical protein [Butyricicoccus pullicaecorum]MDO4668643.1 hypothetical protein [Butyricicoccus pullicaecorum]
MKKSIVLSCSMLLAVVVSGNALAHEYQLIRPQNIKVSTRLSSNYAEDTLLSRIQDNVFVEVRDIEGISQDWECGVELFELPMKKVAAGEKKYAIRVRADHINTNNPQTYKSESNSEDYNKNNVSCSVFVQMEWTDGKGDDNTIDSITGEVTMSEGECYSGKIAWGKSHNRLDSSKSTRNPYSFTVYPNFTARTLHGHYQVNVDEPSTSYDVTVCASPSIFD